MKIARITATDTRGCIICVWAMPDDQAGVAARKQIDMILDYERARVVDKSDRDKREDDASSVRWFPCFVTIPGQAELIIGNIFLTHKAAAEHVAPTHFYRILDSPDLFMRTKEGRGDRAQNLSAAKPLLVLSYSFWLGASA